MAVSLFGVRKVSEIALYVVGILFGCCYLYFGRY